MMIHKLMWAAFVTGIATVALVGGSYLFIPSLIWLAFAASVAVGYLAYEFGDVVRAVPRIWRETVLPELLGVWGIAEELRETSREAWREWRATPHPFFLFGAVLAALAVGNLLVLDFTDPQTEVTNWRVEISIALFFFFLLSSLGTLVALLFATLGARVFEDCSWDKCFTELYAYEPKENKRHLYQYVPLTYGNAYRWMLKGIFYSIPALVRITLRFVVALIRVIHSEKRLMVAVDGPLGGLVSLYFYTLFQSEAGNFIEYLFVAVSGGFISAALVAANYEIVAKRFYHFFPSEN